MASSTFSLILVGLFVPYIPIYAQISTSEELTQVQSQRTILSKLDTKINEVEIQMHGFPLQRPETAETTYVMTHNNGHATPHHHKRHLQNAYRILVLLGWGILLPLGVVIARYCRTVPLKLNEWYYCHIMCQTLGYILGILGWSFGLWLEKSSKEFVPKTQHTLSIIAFTFINIQMLSICIRPNKEAGYCKCWNICHHVLGYAIIGIVIADIFEGLNNNQNHNEKLKWGYVGVLGVLALIVVPIEIFRCKSMIMHLSLHFTRSMFTNSPESS
ncbi:hypothetical protein PIB30_012458 [Stylosanthes scabra]|uniref:Cytochrome b561 domain-containing protein n=1 Tax=Stylosanthes scabra TaxID=79078 RepID=A0ABU6T5U6_9FABA|nr:hypothetical protein [Stylosanthes scabra]